MIHCFRLKTHRADGWLPDGRAVGGLGEKGQGSKKHRLVVIKQSWGYKVQRRKHSQ